MTTDRDTPTQTTDALTPSATRDTTNHQQVRPEGGDSRANADSPEGGTGQPGERVVGKGAGTDTSGAVAPPAAGNLPGGSADLDGTPGALTPGSQGRQGSY